MDALIAIIVISIFVILSVYVKKRFLYSYLNLKIRIIPELIIGIFSLMLTAHADITAKVPPENVTKLIFLFLALNLCNLVLYLLCNTVLTLGYILINTKTRNTILTQYQSRKMVNDVRRLLKGRNGNKNGCMVRKLIDVNQMIISIDKTNEEALACINYQLEAIKKAYGESDIAKMIRTWLAHPNINNLKKSLYDPLIGEEIVNAIQIYGLDISQLYNQGFINFQELAKPNLDFSILKSGIDGEKRVIKELDLYKDYFHYHPNIRLLGSI
ncbi:hypothetical protein M3N64_09465 [Sporolactobacillus sp. CPB3-1]|uniref:Uncharacterized protein n=1 Tax=Sporolactobacillus mangiferae TaxID=2940498 RepID=A0ABT0MBC3_9BACL|nr:hypothetical protein [Sporolactobacillus mangiferae]MCL1632171.1 hypothetical protein [Sporolactobacillus mangiferae]